MGMTAPQTIAGLARAERAIASHLTALRAHRIDRLRLILALHDEHGYSYRAIGEHLGVSKPRAQQIVTEARALGQPG